MKTLFIPLLILIVSGCNLLEDPTPAAPSCFDSISNGTETDIDCGGACQVCTNGRACLGESDCASDQCEDKICTKIDEVTCSDAIRNGDESDVDCGGSCDTCGDGQLCSGNNDCASKACDEKRCTRETMLCENGVQDPNETEIDCGGSCPTCRIDWWRPEWGSRREIRFKNAIEATNTHLFISLPDSGALEKNVRFVMDGTLLASQVDEAGSGDFWVLFPEILAGENVLFVYTESSDADLFPPPDPWATHLAVYHSPDQIDAGQNLGVPVSTADEIEGIFNTAVRFDGTNYIIVPDPDDKMDTLYPHLSISAWVRPTSGTRNWEIPFSRQFSTTFTDDFVCGLNNGVFNACVSGECAPTSTLPINIWTHIAFVHDGTTLRVYLNGELAAEMSFTRLIPPLSNDLIIGGNRNSAEDLVNENFYGDIDELRLSSELISEATFLTQVQSRAENFFTFSNPQVQ